MCTGGGGDNDVIAAPIALHGVVYTAPQPPHHNHFTALFPGPPGWAGARREFLNFMLQRKINRGRHTNHLD